MFNLNPNKKVTSKKVDAVINLLDPKNLTLGIICKEIILKLKSKDLENAIFDFVDYNEKYDTFKVETVDCPKFNKVVNVIFKNNDLTSIANELDRMINYLINEGIKSIAIPTTSLEYLKLDYSDINDLVLNVVSNYSDNDNIDIEVFNYIDEAIFKRYRDNFDKLINTTDSCCVYNEQKSFSKEYVKTPTKPKELTKEELHAKKVKKNKTYLSAKAMGKINEKDFFIGDEEIYDRPILFFEDYAMNYNYNLRKLVNIASKDTKGRRNSQLFNENRPISKKSIFILGYLLEFNQTLIVEALVHFGYCYNLNYPLDLFFFKYFQGDSIKYKNFSELQQYYYEENHELIYV